MRWPFRRQRPPLLEPREGYRRWAPTYGLEPNELQRLEHAAVLELLPPLAGGRAVDVGCGAGRLARLARERGASNVVGVDDSLAMMRQARTAASSALWLVSGAADLPFSDGRFDVVTCGLVLGHLADLHGAVLELGRVLAPGGILLLSDFHPFASMRGMERTFHDPESGTTVAIAHHLHLFEEYVRALDAAGLVLEALREPCYRGMPVVFVLRARKEAA